MITAFDAHLEKANHNLNLLNDLNATFPADYADWKVIGAFYAALHLAHAHVAHYLDQTNVPDDDYLHKLHKEGLSFTQRQKQGIDLDLTSHIGFLKYINPNGMFNNNLKGYWLDNNAYVAYDYLYEKSKDARYYLKVEDLPLIRLEKKQISEGHLKKSFKKLSIIRSFVLNSCRLSENEIVALK